MGRGSTWSRQLPWLTRLGAVYTYDAPWHRGRDVEDPHPISTERFVSDLGDAVAALGRPAIMVGHSMGALHSWCLAATRPELVSALVVEDMAPDFRGRTTGPWEPWLHALPVEFESAQEVYDEFGPVAGQYFLEAFDRTATGWRLHGHTSDWIEIAAEWGTRDYWNQWEAVRVPALLIEAGNSVTPPGQMRRMAGNRLPDNVFARARSRSPDPRRCPADLPRGGRVVSSDARPWRLRLGQNGCFSKRVRIASTSCPTRKASRSSSKSRPIMGPDHPELVEAQSQRTRAMCGPAERRCHREGGDQDEECECSGHGSNTPL